MIRIVVEGFSEVSQDAALADAMAKAAVYLSDSHDVNIAIRELSALPGRGYKAVLEVTITPFTWRETLHRAGADIELKRLQEAEYRARRRYQERHKRHEIGLYLNRTRGYSADVPDILLADLKDADLLNEQIEKAFFYATYYRKKAEVPEPEPHIPPLREVLGRKARPQSHPQSRRRPDHQDPEPE